MKMSPFMPYSPSAEEQPFICDGPCYNPFNVCPSHLCPSQINWIFLYHFCLQILQFLKVSFFLPESGIGICFIPSKIFPSDLIWNNLPFTRQLQEITRQVEQINVWKGRSGLLTKSQSVHHSPNSLLSSRVCDRVSALYPNKGSSVHPKSERRILTWIFHLLKNKSKLQISINSW